MREHQPSRSGARRLAPGNTVSDSVAERPDQHDAQFENGQQNGGDDQLLPDKKHIHRGTSLECLAQTTCLAHTRRISLGVNALGYRRSWTE
jgi:hypothetical protein